MTTRRGEVGKPGNAREDFCGSDVPGDAPIRLYAIRAEAEAEGQIHLGYGMSAGTRKIRVGRYPVADRGACLAADSL